VVAEEEEGGRARRWNERTNGGSSSAQEAAPAAAPSVAELKKLKLSDLTAALRKRGLVTGGNKAERAERLRRQGGTAP
jgi:hypothetical protein